MMAWKAEVESMGQAMAKPSAVSANETRNTVRTTSRKGLKPICTPTSGANIRKIKPLRGSERGASENFSQNDGRPRNGRDQNRKQEAFLAVLDDRHHGEDAGEQHDHDERTGIKIVQIMLLALRVAGAEGCSEAGAEHDPEHQRGCDHADDATALPVETDQFAPPEGEGGERHAGGSRDAAGKSCRLRGQSLISFLRRWDGFLFAGEIATVAAFPEHVQEEKSGQG